MVSDHASDDPELHLREWAVQVRLSTWQQDSAWLGRAVWIHYDNLTVLILDYARVVLRIDNFVELWRM